MEVGCLEHLGASTIGSQPLDWNNAPMIETTAQPMIDVVSYRLPMSEHLWPQALKEILVLNSSKLHLNALITLEYCS